MKRIPARKLLADALLELSEEKPLDKITIKEIVARCGLSSQTFYNNFSDKYELILWIHKSFGDVLIEQIYNEEITYRELSLKNLKFYSEHCSFMLNALNNTHGRDSYRVQASEIAINSTVEYIKHKFDLDKLSDEEIMHIRMYIYGTTEACFEWAKQGLPLSIEKMSDYILNAMPVTLKKYFP